MRVLTRLRTVFGARKWDRVYFLPLCHARRVWLRCAIKFRPVVFLPLFLFGCATADFSPYVGGQQKWPTAKGAFGTIMVNGYDRTGRSGTRSIASFAASEKDLQVLNW